MNYTKTFFVAALVCLGGCATPVKTIDYYDLSSDALGNLRGMTFLPEQVVSDGGYTDLGIVQGFSCRGVRKGSVLVDDSNSKRNAYEQLKLNAAVMSAEHVTEPQCVVSEKMDMNNNCWTSLTCSSHALVEDSVAP